MTIHRIALAALLGVASLHAASIEEHLKARPTSYSCDMTVVSGTTTVEMHQAIADKMLRVEMTKPMPMAMIIRNDQGKMITLMLGMKMAMVKPLNETEAKQFAPPSLEASTYEFSAAGQETISGVACDKFTVTPKAGQSGQPGTVWVGQTDHAVRKFASTDNKTTATMTGYVFEAPKADLFEIPADFKQMAAPDKR